VVPQEALRPSYLRLQTGQNLMLKSVSKRAAIKYENLGHTGPVSHQLLSRQMRIEAEIERTLRVANELQRRREGESIYTRLYTISC
jgi:hypothetical protein